jgi:uncharacterized damage-inducible protein DinB
MRISPVFILYATLISYDRYKKMKEFFKILFEYNHCSNHKIAEAFSTRPEKISEKTIKLYNHILNAHNIWNSRIQSTKSSFGVWDIHSLQDIETIDNMNFEATVQILKEQENLDLTIQYSTTNGLVFHNTVQDILFHIVNHSSYHRGQIATELRSAGLQPPATDYILYRR